MEIKPGLQRTGTLDLQATQRDADQAGYVTFVMPKGIADRGSFFDAVRSVFPLDPPLLDSRSWDALSDSLWEGLHTLATSRIAILWPDTGAMAKSASSDFATAVNVLADIATSLADPQLTCGTPKQVAVIVE